MTTAISQEPLTSSGFELDLSPESFGELQNSGDLVKKDEALRTRMASDGYLFLRNALDRDEVLDARRVVLEQLASEGQLDPSAPLMDGVSRDSRASSFRGHKANSNKPLMRVLREGPMMDIFRRLLGAPVRHYDYTWLRTVPGGANGIYPHTDIVYMGRGTFNLYTAWTPLGDIPVNVGGLMILENSHRHADRLHPYLTRDVDQYCTNRTDAEDIASGRKQWQDWDGRLSKNPVSLRQKLGGRWLTTDFQVGDVLIFGMATVHASLDNHSDRFRISSDSRYQLASEPVDERWISIDGAEPIGHGVAGKKGKIC